MLKHFTYPLSSLFSIPNNTLAYPTYNFATKKAARSPIFPPNAHSPLVLFPQHSAHDIKYTFSKRNSKRTISSDCTRMKDVEKRPAANRDRSNLTGITFYIVGRQRSTKLNGIIAKARPRLRYFSRDLPAQLTAPSLFHVSRAD